MEPLRLKKLRDPLAPVEFPNGRVFAVCEFDADMKSLFRDIQAAPTEEKYRALYHMIVPDATDKDWASMMPEDLMNLLMHAGSKEALVQEMIEERRKNGLAGMIALADRIRLSFQTTKSPTSAPVSRGPIPAPGVTGTSGAPPTGKRSSRSTRSRKSNASINSSPTSTP